MKNTVISFFLACIPFLNIYPQDDGEQASKNRERFIHVEAGYIFPGGVIKESVAIRQNLSYYYVNQYSEGYIYSLTSGLVLALRYEYFLPGLRSGISTGLRFTGFSTDISGYTSGSSDFFYLRYSMQNNDTRFARVKSLTESNYFISIPLEVRVIPFHYKNLSLYAKAGIEHSILRLRKGADVEFQNDDMDVHKDVVLGNIAATTNKNYSTFYSAIGIKLGKNNKPNYMFEVLLPSIFLTDNNFSLIDVNYFAGFNLVVQFPVKNQK